ncbi:MAG: hypothetical protein WBR24_24390 [Desulfobacterales bacterium]|jgi:hypothetical protein
MVKRQKKKEKRRELTYQQKTIEMARVHWEKEKKESFHQRRTFRGLQIVPTANFYDESHGHKPGENN